MLSTPTKHALQALIYLAREESDDFVPVVSLAEATSVPSAYLSKIIKILSKNGVVATKRGVSGGVRFNGKSISFYEVCEVMQDPILNERCLLSSKACNEYSPCPFHEKWGKERDRIEEFLRRAQVNRLV